jgi:Xaa-Pro aminopeptidase
MRLPVHTLQFQKRLRSLKIDAYWVTHSPDLFYLSGFGAEGCWGLVGRGPAALFTPVLVAEQAASLAKGFEVVQLKKLSEAYSNVATSLAKKQWRKVGYDPYRVPEAAIVAMRKATGKKVQWVPAPGAVGALRLRKDSKELEALRAAGHAVAKGFAYIRKIARPGLRECDLAAEFEWYIRKHGATKASFDSIVASGENSAYPHYLTGDRILRRNDIVLCDLGALVDGYCSDLTRTFFLGTISSMGHRVYDTVARAQELAIQAVKPGAKASQIDRIARDEIERTGYGRRFIHSTGHGVGVEVHEAPWIGPNSPGVLEPGMVLTVEPGVYLPGWGGVRIEDTLLVTKTGYEILTK